MATFTVFCREASGEGTMWISAVEAGDAEIAAAAGTVECADAWEMDTDDVVCVGVAKGDVEILFWDDDV